MQRPENIDLSNGGVLTGEQKNALYLLNVALQTASESGLLDNLDLHPDIINSFCDTITEHSEHEFKS